MPKLLLVGFFQVTVPRTQILGNVSRANETSTDSPVEISSLVLIDIPPELSSWLVAVNLRLAPVMTETSVMTGMRT